MAGRDVDEYKPIKFYADNTQVKQSGFSKFQVGDEHFFCRYSEGEIAMLSQAYTSKAGRDNGIESVKKNEKISKRFRFEDRPGGKHGFSLRAGNSQEIAISPDYNSQAAASRVTGRLSGGTTGATTGNANAASMTPAAKTPSPARKKAAAAKRPVTKAKPPAKAPAKAKAQPKPKAKPVQAPRLKSNEDEYMPVAYYRQNIKARKNGFQRFKGDNGEYYFTYSENEKLALISEGYPTVAARDNGLESVQTNMKLEKRYVYGEGAEGKPGFKLRAGNNKEIARSVGYGSAAAAAAGAAYLIGTRRRAPVTSTKSAASKPVVKAAAIPVAAAVVKPKPKSTPKPAPKPKAKTAAPIAAAAVASVAAAKALPKGKVQVTKVTPKKAAPVKAKGTVPVKAAAIVAAPIAVAAVAAAAIVPKPAPKPVAAAPIAAAPIAKAPVVAAPVMAAAAAVPAATASGGGIWGWLKWLLLALLALLAMFFLFKACVGGEKVTKAVPPVTVQETAVPAAMVACWNGTKAKDDAACPTKVTCWDSSFAISDAACPVQPPAKNVACWDGSMAVDKGACPIKAAAPKVALAAKMTAPSISGRICGPSSNPLFDVNNMTPVNVTRLGTNPQFGDSMTLTPDGFYRKLKAAYDTDREDRLFLDLVAKSLGHGSFNNMDASMFSNDTLTNGSSGLLAFGSDHALQFSSMNMKDASHFDAFKVRSANGTDVHFMKRCGNFMYVCQP